MKKWSKNAEVIPLLDFKRECEMEWFYCKNKWMSVELEPVIRDFRQKDIRRHVVSDSWGRQESDSVIICDSWSICLSDSKSFRWETESFHTLCLSTYDARWKDGKRDLLLLPRNMKKSEVPAHYLTPVSHPWSSRLSFFFERRTQSSLTMLQLFLLLLSLMHEEKEWDLNILLREWQVSQEYITPSLLFFLLFAPEKRERMSVLDSCWWICVFTACFRSSHPNQKDLFSRSSGEEKVNDTSVMMCWFYFSCRCFSSLFHLNISAAIRLATCSFFIR